MNVRISLIATLSAAGFMLPGMARAVVIDPGPQLGSYYGYGKFNAFRTDEPFVPGVSQEEGHYGDQDFFGNAFENTSSSSAQNTLNLGTAPSISSSAEADYHPHSYEGGHAILNFNYLLEITGPQNTTVQVHIEASGGTKATTSASNLRGSAEAKASLKVNSATDVVYENNIRSLANHVAGSSSAQDSFHVDDYYSFATNVIYGVTLETETNTVLDSAFNDQERVIASAFVDPYFQLAPGYSDYKLYFSEGINNTLVSAVPLPPSAPMFGAAVLGLGTVGYGMRRRRWAAAA